MNSEKTIYSVLAEISENRLGISFENISEDSRLIEDLGASSIDIVIMLSDAEDRLEITIPDDILLSMKTVGRAAAKISEISGLPSGVKTVLTESEDNSEDQ